MILSHAPASPLRGWMGAIGFVSAAEGFFLLSGVVLGIVSRRRLAREGQACGARRLLRRAAMLWLINLALVVAFAAWDYAGRRYGFFHFGYTYDWVFWGRWQLASLLSFDQPYLLQILPRYAVFLAVAPAAIWLLAQGRWRWLLAATVGIWLLTHAPGIDSRIPLLEHGRVVGFRFSAWQALFFVGLLIGWHRAQLAGVWQVLTRPVVLLTLAAVTAGFVALAWARQAGMFEALPEAIDRRLFSRELLGLARWPNLLAVFVLVFWLTNRYWPLIRRVCGAVLLPLGQNALLVFVLHIPLVFVALAGVKLLAPSLEGTWPAAFLGAGVVVLIWLIARWPQRSGSAAPAGRG